MPAAAPPSSVKLSWIITAFTLMLALAAGCAYLSLCLLFYQGQWQILFHPSHTVSTTPASAGLAFEAVRFDPSEAGTPQLTGWWVPGARQAGDTVLYLHGGDGSLADTVPALALLHSLGTNVLAIDYRGFGASAALHPSEQSMLADTQAALNYLEDLRHIAPGLIVLDGRGLGATIAAESAVRNQGLRAVVLEDVSAPARITLAADPRTKLLPLSLLATSRFDPADALRVPGPPKLFVGTNAETLRAYQSAAAPKLYTPEAAAGGLRRFLDGR